MVAVISDTHMPKGERELPARCLQLLGDAELIVHAGDWSGSEVVDAIERIGPPVVGVHGNVEEDAVRERLPERTSFELGERTIGVVHDAGPKRGRLARLRRLFPEADAVIFGHSHIPLLESVPEGGGPDSFQIFNPGSPTERRRAPVHTMGRLELGPEGGLQFSHLEL